MGKASRTPLQAEADRLVEERRRRQEAVRAAQQYALRALPGRTASAHAPAMSGAPAEEASEKPPLDFDAVRQAMHDERQRDARSGDGAKSRHVPPVDDQRAADET